MQQMKTKTAANIQMLYGVCVCCNLPDLSHSFESGATFSNFPGMIIICNICGIHQKTNYLLQIEKNSESSEERTFSYFCTFQNMFFEIHIKHIILRSIVYPFINNQKR